MFKVADPEDTATQPTINSPRKQPGVNVNLRPLEDVRSFRTALDRSDRAKDSHGSSLVKQEASTMSSSQPLAASLLTLLTAFILLLR